MRSLSIVTAALTTAVVAGCAGEGGVPGECGAFATVLTVKNRMSQAASAFDRNEPIVFELLTTNTRNAPATLTASSSCTAVVFEVTDSAQRRHWGSADDIACIQMLQPRTFEPLEAVNEQATWDQRDADGATVPSGTYTVSAVVGQYLAEANDLVDCRSALGKSATFTIR